MSSTIHIILDDAPVVTITLVVIQGSDPFQSSGVCVLVCGYVCVGLCVCVCVCVCVKAARPASSVGRSWDY